ncbi:sugar transferase [Bremerella sp. JC817]|uniref:sugar transferase n=1 Tax=Bremerella sp. JC817 TaxID=3231756 RepID=UPI003459C87C
MAALTRETNDAENVRPLRILHVVGGSGFGGASIFVSRLAAFCQRHGYHVDVLTTDPKLQATLKAAGIGVVDLDVIWREIRPLKDLSGARKLARYLKTAGYDIVHTHTSKGGIVGRWAAWKAGVPFVLHTVHGFAFHEESSPPKLWIYSNAERMAARWCHRIVTVSEYHRDWARELKIGQSHQVVAIPNGVSTKCAEAKRTPEEVREELGVCQDTVLMLAPGRLAPQKGLKYLVEAAQKLEGRASLPYLFLLAGDGPLKEELEQQAESLGVADKFRFLGFRDDVGDLLAACDVVVLPSLWEGLSLALLEAMMVGKPVISTEIGSNREVCAKGDAVRLVPPKDSTALADAIADLIDSPEQRFDLAQTGQQIAIDHYGEERMMNQYLELYDELGQGNDSAKKTNGTPSPEPGREIDKRVIRIDSPEVSPGKPIAPRYLYWKEPLERLAAGIALVCCLPLLGALIAIVKLSSPGPGLYSQKRVGKGGRIFTLYKLRSMRSDAESKSGPVWAQSGDPRVTRLGKFLRASHLDELPQLWNVANGDMSLIGPRPERPEFVAILEKSIPHYLDRLEVLPGITGLAQINLPPDSDNESVWRKLLLDRAYIQRASFWMDFGILALTGLRVVGLRGPGVRGAFKLYIDGDLLPPMPIATVDPALTEAAFESSPVETIAD